MSLSRSTFLMRLLRWRFLVFVSLFAAVFLSVALGRETVRRRAIDAEIRSLQTQVDTLAARNTEISQLQSALQTESFIEREARLKLGLKKPGESMVVIQDQDRARRDTALSPNADDPLDLVIDDASSAPALGNASKWWYYFFDRNAFNHLSDL